MKTAKLLTLMALFILTLCVEVTAQDLSSLTPGDRIRVAPLKEPNRKDSAIYHSHSSDAIIMTLEKSGKRVKVPLTAIASLEVCWATKRNGWAGAGMGLAAGALLGITIGAASEDTSDPYAGLAPLAGLAIGAPAGLFLGTVIGLQINTKQWEEVPLGSDY
ncbi:MAG: hypothetical protein ACREOI_29810 [bacterium]